MAPVFRGIEGKEGTRASTVLDYFGLEASEKAVYFSIVTESMWKQLRRELIIKMQIDAGAVTYYRASEQYRWKKSAAVFDWWARV